MANQWQSGFLRDDTTGALVVSGGAGGAGGSGAILPWTTATAYVIGQPVTNSGHTYTAVDAHTSGATFAGDLASHWALLPMTAADVAAQPTGQSFLGRSLGFASDRSIHSTNQNSNGTNTQHMSRKRMKVSQAVADLAFPFVNWNEWNQAAIGNNISLRATLEYPSGSFTPLFFNGRRDVTIEPDSIVLSDPVGVPVVAGTVIFVRTYVTVTSGDKWNNNFVCDDTLGEGGESGTSANDKLTSGTVTAAYGYAYGPTGVAGLAGPGTRPAIGGVGDSIVFGSGDGAGPGQGADTFDWGFGRRAAVTMGNPFINAGLGGDRYQNWASSTNYAVRGYYLRRLLVSGCRYIVCHLGINDVTTGRTLAQIQADALSTSTAWTSAGITVYVDTLTPVSTSSDSWATVGNQTTHANNAVRVNFNNWLRDGAPIDATTKAAVAVGTSSNVLRVGAVGHPFHAVLEMADVVESARDSGKWKASYTADGTHPTPTGHTAMAAVMQPAQFA